MRTTREPRKDMRAQVAAVKDPRSAKRAAFIAKGTKVPPAAGLMKVARPEGTLLTNSAAHAAAFAAPGPLAPRMPGLLGYPEHKMATVNPVVVQGRTPPNGKNGGAVAHESVASGTPAGLLAAGLAAKAAVPRGKVVVTTPQAVQARRKGVR